MKTTKFVASLALTSLVACGGGGDTIEGNNENNLALSLEVENGTTNPPQFNTLDTTTLTWSTPRDAYTLFLHLSDNETLSSIDTELVEYDCGLTEACASTGQVSFECTFGNDNWIRCADTNFSFSYNLTGILPQLPYAGYMIAEYCTFPLDECTQTATAEVSFQ